MKAGDMVAGVHVRLSSAGFPKPSARRIAGLDRQPHELFVITDLQWWCSVITFACREWLAFLTSMYQATCGTHGLRGSRFHIPDFEVSRH